ncbi:MAG TPA: 2-phospho-L-lactate transferase [Spongiibacteraceae bacterium]|nr:2-phospho-L-lactate transferase [Spongiibacteraceae bacterium]
MTKGAISNASLPDDSSGRRVLALSGGVGGAKLALGLTHQLTPAQLTIVCNTGDDFYHYGLPICPDLDTVMYTLAARNNSEQGWGLAGESWRTLEALAQVGGETWFRLGDLDIATHLQRGELLRRGATLSAATDELRRHFKIDYTILPMSDDPVSTMVATEAGELSFQHYFVREQCRPAVSGFRFHGIEAARPQPQFIAQLHAAELAAVIICPSNPFVSIDPILQLAGVRAALRDRLAPVVAVSPIVGGVAIKGPAAKMLAELKLPSSALAVAEHYADVLDGIVIDETDAVLATAIEELGIAVHIAQTVMSSLDDRIDLAREVLLFAERLSGEV